MGLTMNHELTQASSTVIAVPPSSEVAVKPSSFFRAYNTRSEEDGDNDGDDDGEDDDNFEVVKLHLLSYILQATLLTWSYIDCNGDDGGDFGDDGCDVYGDDGGDNDDVGNIWVVWKFLDALASLDFMLSVSW